ncbi:transmembrane protein 131-like [Spea bombifrons]|uniref:transmembrane protein 131-like n=1 Tax=Spea bombifrons TaxID=233779 RepID=UPI0023494555|nr:transmembrane protein 131-like [Spea bombifrons]
MAGLLHPYRGSPRCTATAVNLMLGVFHVLLPCFRQGGGQVIEPVPSMVELWQAEDAELMLPPQADSDQTTGEHSQEQSYPRPSGRALHLQPSVLDFGSQPVGLPKAQSFCAFNPSWDTNVEVKSVFTNGRHFHVSPIQSRVIPARGRSSFTVVFFPELEGSFEGTLFLNTTSHGILSYQVFGLGTSMFVSNDSRNPLQNIDVIFPHLENIHLSQSQTEAINSSVWQVRLKCSVPFKKQQQCRSCFLSGHSLLLQIYFAVRLDGGQQDLETLRKYILENIFMIFVTADPQENLDDPTMHVYVLNSGNGLVHMQDIHHFLGDSLSVQFEPVMLLSSSINFTKAASVSCTVAASDPEFDCSGKKKLTVLEAASPPYLCFSRNVTEGYIKFDTSKISFYMQPFQDPVGLWSVWLENNLNFRISLFEVVLADEAKSIFKIRNFTHMSALPPGCWDVFTLKIQAKDTQLDHLTKMRITTSTGVAYEVPIHIHSVFSKPGNPQFKKLHAQCGLHPIIRSLDHEQMHRWQKTFSLGLSAWSVDYELGTELYEKYQKLQDGAACRKKTSEATGSVQQNRDAEKPISRLLQLIAEPGLVVNFAATALSNSSVNYVTLKNPSPFPVTLQLLPLSLYPNPQALLALLSKWYGVSEEGIDFTTAEFRLQKERRHPLEEQDDRSLEILELTLLPWESRQVGVVFTPTDYRKVTSLIVIRNNLTILDMITVEGVGAREMLRVGGRLPGIGGSLRFKVPESTLMDCRQQLKESKQVLSITKVFKVENIGSLPITVLSMKINGYNCQGFGFEVLDCNTFSLGQNSSRELSIVFIPDFTSSWVIRELTLVTASSLEFRFTLNVTLPHHLLPLCADGVPGPSWEESFWRLTVVFVSFSLLSVVLIAFQQAQYILTEFLKLRHRSGGVSSNCQQNPSTVDTISSESYRSSCKSFSDSCSPPDKGKGKGFLAVTAPPSRSQNASKRGPASYSHSQKKHKCSVYYSIKQKSNSSTGSAAAACDAGQQHTSDTRPPSPRDSPCSEAPRENWPDCKPSDASDTGNQKHLTSPAAALGKEEPSPQNTLLPQRTAGESTSKEEPIKCMFPMETSLKISESVSEPKQQDSCVTVSSKVPENHSSRSLQQTASKKMEGNGRRVSLGLNREGSDTAKKHIVREGTSERSVQSVPREERTCGRSNISPVKQEDSLRKKSPVEKRDGIFPNLNWNKNRTQARKSKKKNSVFTARGTDQYEMKIKSQEPERPEVRIQNRVKNWSSFANGDVCKVEQKSARLPARGETECYQILKRKCMDKFSSDSSSDCGSSRGSVRASRGSWGSWSSTSSSDGDKKNALPKQHYFPTRDTISQSGFPSEAPIALNLSHNICNTSSEANPISRYPEVLSPSFTNASDAEKRKGLYPQDDLWSSQPVCLTNDLNYNLESTMTCVMQDPPPVQNSYVNWNGSCDGQFSRMYGSLELNDFSSYPEENMNYHNGFPCPEAQNPAFIDHQCQSTWSMNGPSAPPTPQTPTVPSTWEPASYVSTSPYLSSTRSLSPMSGLFGSIWAPQNDVFDGYCPASGSPPHSQHVGNHSVICKQEYSSRFNPFHAYMNLDIWTATANRSASFPISRDSGYCGNM